MLNKRQSEAVREHMAHAYMKHPQGRSPEWIQMLSLANELFPGATMEQLLQYARRSARQLGYDVQEETLYVDVTDNE